MVIRNPLIDPIGVPRRFYRARCRGRDPAVTSRIMSRIRCRNTLPERLLGSAMRRLGIRLRKQVRAVGKPDFGLKKFRLAVFVDGDFWHGHEWALKGYSGPEAMLRRYPKYWREKLRRNARRDEFVTGTLRAEGWTVIRFWASDVKKDADRCAREVYAVMKGHGWV